ncbi:MAG TPA: DUF1674 domain-containing protein [Steroidobacteraceae bacterium]|nr:DUF1674 domain-containing protein [Steroidobacteraceae bacterium]
MPVSVPDTLASPELARRCDAPWPQVSVPPGVATDGTVDRPAAPSAEIDGPGGPEPTRYGDWERRGRCIDF